MDQYKEALSFFMRNDMMLESKLLGDLKYKMNDKKITKEYAKVPDKFKITEADVENGTYVEKLKTQIEASAVDGKKDKAVSGYVKKVFGQVMLIVKSLLKKVQEDETVHYKAALGSYADLVNEYCTDEDRAELKASVAKYVQEVFSNEKKVQNQVQYDYIRNDFATDATNMSKKIK